MSKAKLSWKIIHECDDEDGNPVAAPDADWSMAAQYEKEEEVE